MPKSALQSQWRLRHPWLFALPGGELPEEVHCDGQLYRLVEVFKHDFFAGTGLYEGPDGRAVLKMGRVNPALTIPLIWIGRFLARREIHLYAELQDQPGVPKLVGAVGQTGFLHAFVPGHALERHEAVSDTFFDELHELLGEMHRRHIAYVDLNKRQNILVGNDGRPYLIDFQISLHLPPRGWSKLGLVQWLLRIFQRADTYHYLKHKFRLRPDLTTPEERAIVERTSLPIRLHRLIARPLTNLRRRTLQRLRGHEVADVPGSAAK